MKIKKGFWNLFRTKTFWLGLATLSGGVVLVCEGDVPHGVQAIIGGLAMIVGRDAVRKIEETEAPK